MATQIMSALGDFFKVFHHMSILQWTPLVRRRLTLTVSASCWISTQIIKTNGLYNVKIISTKTKQIRPSCPIGFVLGEDSYLLRRKMSMVRAQQWCTRYHLQSIERRSYKSSLFCSSTAVSFLSFHSSPHTIPYLGMTSPHTLRVFWRLVPRLVVKWL